jgi:hypothetical protein
VRALSKSKPDSTSVSGLNEAWSGTGSRSRRGSDFGTLDVLGSGTTDYLSHLLMSNNTNKFSSYGFGDDLSRKGLVPLKAG